MKISRKLKAIAIVHFDMLNPQGESILGLRSILKGENLSFSHTSPPTLLSKSISGEVEENYMKC